MCVRREIVSLCLGGAVEYCGVMLIIGDQKVKKQGYPDSLVFINRTCVAVREDEKVRFLFGLAAKRPDECSEFSVSHLIFADRLEGKQMRRRKNLIGGRKNNG